MDLSLFEDQFSFFLANPADGRLTYVSKKFCSQLRFAKDELLGVELLRLLKGEKTCRRTLSEIRDAVREERPCAVTLLTYTRDKNPFWAQFSLSPLADGDGRLVHFMGMQADVTHLIGSTDPCAPYDDGCLESVAEDIELDSRKLAAALKLEPHWESHGHPPAEASVPCSLKHALSSILSAFVLSNPHLPDCPIVFVSEPFLKLTGYKREQVVGRNCRFLQGPGTSPAEVQKIRDAMANERPVTVTLLNYTADDKPFWNLLHVAPIRDAGGKVAYHIGVQLGMKKEVAASMPTSQGDLPSVSGTNGQSSKGCPAAQRLILGGLLGADSSSTSGVPQQARKSQELDAAADQQQLPPPPQPKFSDKLYYSGVTGAVRVAVRSLGGSGSGLRRGSMDQGLPGSPLYRKSHSSGLHGQRNSQDVTMPRSSMDFAYSGMYKQIKSTDMASDAMH